MNNFYYFEDDYKNKSKIKLVYNPLNEKTFHLIKSLALKANCQCYQLTRINNNLLIEDNKFFPNLNIKFFVLPEGSDFDSVLVINDFEIKNDFNMPNDYILSRIVMVLDALINDSNLEFIERLDCLLYQKFICENEIKIKWNSEFVNWYNGYFAYLLSKGFKQIKYKQKSLHDSVFEKCILFDIKNWSSHYNL